MVAPCVAGTVEDGGQDLAALSVAGTVEGGGQDLVAPSVSVSAEVGGQEEVAPGGLRGRGGRFGGGDRLDRVVVIGGARRSTAQVQLGRRRVRRVHV